MKKLVLLLILSTLAACNNHNRSGSIDSVDANGQDSITGGELVAPNNTRFKSVVGLRMMRAGSNMSGLCTGTLIREDVILTAAHCLVNKEAPWQHIFVVFNNDIKSISDASVRIATHAVVHQSYKDGTRDNSYDIALLQFSGGLPAGYRVAPLMSSQMPFVSGTPLTVAGYGVNSIVREKGSGLLRHAQVKLANPSATQTEFRINQWLRGICMGDSGGPAFVTVNGVDYVAGVSNRTFEIGPFHCIISSYFARVDRFHDWIRNNLKSLKP